MGRMSDSPKRDLTPRTTQFVDNCHDPFPVMWMRRTFNDAHCPVCGQVAVYSLYTVGEVPVGFERTDEGYLCPNLTPCKGEDGYLEIRAALEAIEDVQSCRQTLSRIHQNDERSGWYLDANAGDERVVEALEDVEQ